MLAKPLNCSVNTIVQSPIISGAGIAGLSTALALAHKGIASIVFDRCLEFDNIGAGIQLAPNATRLLQKWGLFGALQKLSVSPHFLDLNDGKNFKTLLRINIEDTAKRRWHAPYITLHRADLHKALYDAAINNPYIKIRLGEKVISAEKQSDKRVKVQTICENKSTKNYCTSLMIACDGAWSKLRQIAPPHDEATYSGFIAWRATIAVDDLPDNFHQSLCDIKTVSAWMGPSNHLIAYPIRAGQYYNFVVITKGKNPGKTWSKQADMHLLAQHFKAWHKNIIEIFNASNQWSYWPIFQMSPHRYSYQDWLVYVGDAAHAFLPFAAQGAAMAIEDAATLAEILADNNGNYKQMLQHYEKLRRKRVNAVHKRGQFNQKIYHATGVFALARNLAMQFRSTESFMADLDWLYNFDATNITKFD